MILGLDLGTKCGWCIILDSGLSRSGVLNMTPKKNDKPGSRYALFLAFLQGLETKPAEVYFESVMRHEGVRAAHVYGGFKAILEMWCYGRNIRCVGLGVGTIKKHATGKGNASKSMMVAAANKRLGRKVIDDNEADAFWIADLGAGDLTFLL